MFDLTPIANAIITLLAAIVTSVIIPLIKSKTTVEQQTKIAAIVKTAVAAAEQLFTGTKQGKQKKEYVLDFLAKNGITLDEAQINALVEAAVYELQKQ